jgi:hypothetical protein
LSDAEEELSGEEEEPPDLEDEVSDVDAELVAVDEELTDVDDELLLPDCESEVSSLITNESTSLVRSSWSAGPSASTTYACDFPKARTP